MYIPQLLLYRCAYTPICLHRSCLPDCMAIPTAPSNLNLLFLPPRLSIRHPTGVSTPTSASASAPYIRASKHFVPE